MKKKKFGRIGLECQQITKWVLFPLLPKCFILYESVMLGPDLVYKFTIRLCLYQYGETYGPRARSGPRRLIFLALTLPFLLKCGPRDTNKAKGAMWPADENIFLPMVFMLKQMRFCDAIIWAV